MPDCTLPVSLGNIYEPGSTGERGHVVFALADGPPEQPVDAMRAIYAALKPGA